MSDTSQHLDALNDIKQMMERSSRFISLSGWSGISAGICALAAAGYAFNLVENFDESVEGARGVEWIFSQRLFWLAIITFIVSFGLAFLFTYQRSHRNNLSIWTITARRVLVNVLIPMLVGGLFIIRLLQSGNFGLVAPACLIFYGLGLVNGGKYTLTEIRYLGYGQILLGLINCWTPAFGLYFWALGFGILHIVYGALMLFKYER